MAEYALINPQGTIDRFSTAVDLTAQVRTGWSWRLVTTVDPGPPPDATQIRTGPVYTIDLNSVTRTFTLRAKTPTELDADKTSAVAAIDMALLRVAFNHENRIRALEAQAPLTLAQFRAAVKALLP